MKGISEKLQKKIPKLKPSQRAIFEVLGVHYDSEIKRKIVKNQQRVPATDRIWDPWGGEDEQGEYVDIMYSIRELPGGRDSLRDKEVELGTILFHKQTGGQISINGSEQAKTGLLEYLYLSNYNQSNIGKEWHIEPKQYLFKFIDEVNIAKEELQKENRMLTAQLLVRDMSEGEVRTHGIGLYKNYKILTNDQIRVKLMDLAKKNPDKIIHISNDVDVSIMKSINQYRDTGLIKRENSSWVYGQTGEEIVRILKNDKQEERLKKWLLSKDGRQDYQNLEQALKEVKVKG